jgi:adenosine deaminase
MKCFDALYNDLPKAELHCHLEGSIRTATIIDIAREHGLSLPAFDVAALDPYVKVYEQLKDLQSVLDAFAIFQNSLASPAAVERIMAELCEDSARQNIKLFEVRFSPDWAFSGHQLDWDAALEGILRAKVRAEAQYDMVIGLIAITSRSLGVGSCEKTVGWAIRHKEVIQGIDLADGEWEHPIHEFVRRVESDRS